MVHTTKRLETITQAIPPLPTKLLISLEEYCEHCYTASLRILVPRHELCLFAEVIAALGTPQQFPIPGVSVSV